MNLATLVTALDQFFDLKKNDSFTKVIGTVQTVALYVLGALAVLQGAGLNVLPEAFRACVIAQ